MPEHRPEAEQPSRAEVEAERESLQERLSEWLDLPLAILALIWTGLLVIELVAVLPPATSERVLQLDFAIWAIFVLVFLVEFALAPAKAHYLHTHALAALSVVLPFVRIVRVVRFARVLRSLSLVRITLITNRATAAIAELFATHLFQYVLALVVVVSVAGAAAVHYFERDVPGSRFADFGETLWWAATLVTTVNVGLEPQTLEGRIVGLGLRIFGMGVFGYAAGSIASFLVGRHVADAQAVRGERAEIAHLIDEVERLRETLERGRTAEPQRDQPRDDEAEAA